MILQEDRTVPKTVRRVWSYKCRPEMCRCSDFLIVNINMDVHMHRMKR